MWKRMIDKANDLLLGGEFVTAREALRARLALRETDHDWRTLLDNALALSRFHRYSPADILRGMHVLTGYGFDAAELPRLVESAAHIRDGAGVDWHQAARYLVEGGDEADSADPDERADRGEIGDTLTPEEDPQMATRAEILHPYNIARRLVGLREVPGSVSNPAILAMLRLDSDWPKDDGTAWCGAFVSTCCALSGYERTKSLRARAWLRVGQSVYLHTPPREGDIVILGRGKRPHPPVNVIDAPGHVGFVVGFVKTSTGAAARVRVLGGNQGDAVSIAEFKIEDVIAYRRLSPAPEPRA